MKADAQDQIVDEQSGEVMTAADYASELRALEREIQRLDSAIAEFKADLSGAKKTREKLIMRMRAVIRERRLQSEASRRRASKGASA